MTRIQSTGTLKGEVGTAADLLEGAVWTAYCLLAVYAGRGTVIWPHLTALITLGMVALFLPIAVWTRRRQAKRGITRWF